MTDATFDTYFTSNNYGFVWSPIDEPGLPLPNHYYQVLNGQIPVAVANDIDEMKAAARWMFKGMMKDGKLKLRKMLIADFFSGGKRNGNFAYMIAVIKEIEKQWNAKMLNYNNTFEQALVTLCDAIAAKLESTKNPVMVQSVDAAVSLRILKCVQFNHQSYDTH